MSNTRIFDDGFLAAQGEIVALLSEFAAIRHRPPVAPTALLREGSLIDVAGLVQVVTLPKDVREKKAGGFTPHPRIQGSGSSQRSAAPRLGRASDPET
jgi:hypothetical protein